MHLCYTVPIFLYRGFYIVTLRLNFPSILCVTDGRTHLQEFGGPNFTQQEFHSALCRKYQTTCNISPRANNIGEIDIHFNLEKFKKGRSPSSHLAKDGNFG